MKGLLTIAMLLAATPAAAFDLQGHRGARGLAPENTLAAFDTALSIGVTTLELDIGMTKDDVLVVSHNRRLNPDHTRGPDGQFLETEGPAIRSLTLAEVRQYDVGRLKPGTRYAADFPEQRPVNGARIPLLADVFALAAERQAHHVRFNIETKITPTSGDETPDPEAFAAALAKAIRDAGLATRASIQSFDWRTLKAMRSIAPEIERVCLTAEAVTLDTIRRGEPGPSPWTAGLDIDDFGGSVPRLVAAAGCQTWSPLYRNARPDDIAAARSLGLKVIPWTVNERAEMERLIGLGVDGIITDYPDHLRAVMAAREMPLPPRSPPR
jgi:glycerophosphoryl diester phosphodiesterase